MKDRTRHSSLSRRASGQYGGKWVNEKTRAQQSTPEKTASSSKWQVVPKLSHQRHAAPPAAALPVQPCTWLLSQRNSHTVVHWILIQTNLQVNIILGQMLDVIKSQPSKSDLILQKELKNCPYQSCIVLPWYVANASTKELKWIFIMSN